MEFLNLFILSNYDLLNLAQWKGKALPFRRFHSFNDDNNKNYHVLMTICVSGVVLGVLSALKNMLGNLKRDTYFLGKIHIMQMMYHISYICSNPPR